MFNSFHFQIHFTGCSRSCPFSSMSFGSPVVSSCFPSKTLRTIQFCSGSLLIAENNFDSFFLRTDLISVCLWPGWLVHDPDMSSCSHHALNWHSRCCRSLCQSTTRQPVLGGPGHCLQTCLLPLETETVSDSNL